MNINENEVDKLVEEAAAQIKKTPEEILAEKKNNPGREVPKTTEPKDEINLGELGKFKKVTLKEADEVFSHLATMVFQIHKCMFRVSYINDGKYKFTAELINLDETTK